MTLKTIHNAEHCNRGQQTCDEHKAGFHVNAVAQKN